MYEASFTVEFWTGDEFSDHGAYDPNGHWPDPRPFPCSVAEALVLAFRDESERAEIEEALPYLRGMGEVEWVWSVLSQAREVSMMGSLRPPVDVFLDDPGYLTVRVFEE